MNTDAFHTNPQEDLLDCLQRLLEKQEQRIRKSDFRSVELLCEQTDPIIAALAKIIPSQPPPSKKRCEQLIKHYKKLELMIESQKDAIHKQLRKVEAGKKTIQAYHTKI